MTREQHLVKRCSRCKGVFPLSAFGPSNFGRFQRRSACTACRRIQERERLLDPDAHKGHKDSQIKYQYGITGAVYDAMVDEQDGRCALCRQPSKDRLAVDHDHACCSGRRSCGGCVRGLLCQRCNAMLAFLELPGMLRAAQSYLRYGTRAQRQTSVSNADVWAADATDQGWGGPL